MQLVKTTLFVLFTSLFIQCNGGYNHHVIYNHIAIEERQNKPSKRVRKVDTLEFENNAIIYSSTINATLSRKFLINNSETKLDKNSHLGIPLDYIDTKVFQVDGKEYSVTKFLLDVPFSEDEESLKFYCSDLGIFMEIFSRNTVIRSISVNDSKSGILDKIIDQIELDTIFSSRKSS